MDSKIKEEVAKGEGASIINLVDYLIERAHEIGASDIHIDPSEKNVRVRMRIDGVLHNICELTKKIHPEMISRIKVLSRMRTDEHESTQDGRFRYSFPNTNKFIDTRVSIAPTYHGENAVLRLLSDKAGNFNLESLGFSESDREKITSALKKPSGMILATGPTGSGKTTTLYTLIKMLNSKDVSIVTIEDPIEYAVDGVEQIQINSRTGLTFANGLRSILRQDPNIIMVGEIRDSETASISVNTALTGHLMLSTLHTNDSATTLPRLLDMGVEAYLVASTINIAIGQRLVRKICQHCKTENKVSDALKQSLSNTSLSELINKQENLFRGMGCNRCNGSGYSGRICINEILVADDEIREAILKKASSSDLRKIAIKNGMTSMLNDGYYKAMNGQTTIEEILRVVHE
ncbi:MAG: type II secretion system protein GspE [Candidatus Zambryskibacteria bacterium CG_4_9_14_3_um_filter_40_16]|uniref:Type II secretion system protein GspE n=2 Tax=Candidatus Zambryskiibacteriota TaxID=1817925 RepID=A0A2H0K6X7_9BACT|nr:MAG: type II secretion system protein GspE [Candidatus Zambryskibacteria bacterium CG11_big_fil_rev_8_21_14_0_20_40_24]PJA34305.1 MAG: type II secretion system protein GspE [Candidatus Zambryskibacteria bacterium CG_4_9_14_3_um_filter_40_16]